MKSTVVLIFAMLFPSVAAYFYFVRLSGSGQEANALVATIYAATKTFMLLLPVLYFFTIDRRWHPFRRGKSRGLILAIAFGLVVAATIIGLSEIWAQTLLKNVPEQVRRKIAEFGITTPLSYLLMSVFLSTIHAFLEEYYWRWFVFGRLRLQSMSFFWAATLSSLGFMGHHVFVLNEYLPGQFWNATVPFSLCIAVGGFVWAWMFERTGSLVGPWLSHLLVDAAIMTVGYRMYFMNY